MTRLLLDQSQDKQNHQLQVIKFQRGKRQIKKKKKNNKKQNSLQQGTKNQLG